MLNGVAPHPAIGHPLPVGEGTRSGGSGGQGFGHLLPPGEGAAQRRIRGAAPRPVPPLTRPSATLSQWEREHAAADQGGRASATFSRREKVPRSGGSGGQRLGQYHPSPGLRPPSPSGRGNTQRRIRGAGLRPPSPAGRRCRAAADQGGSASASTTPHPAFGHPLPVGEGTRSGGSGGQGFGYLLPRLMRSWPLQ